MISSLFVVRRCKIGLPLLLHIYLAATTLDVPYALSATLEVGPGQTLQLPSHAAEHAQDGDIVQIHPGDYVGDVAVWTSDNLLIRGSRQERPRVHAGGHAAEDKAIWIVKGDNVTIDGIEFFGATSSSANGAAIRPEGGSITIRNSFFKGNQVGVRAAAAPESTIVIENSEFADTASEKRPTSAITINNIKRFVLRGNYIHHTSLGHQIKTRALENEFIANRISDEEDGTSSYALDISSFERTLIIGNILQQGELSENKHLIRLYGPKDGAAATLINNTFSSDINSGVALRNDFDLPATLYNNLLIGSLELSAGPVQGAGNIKLHTHVSGYANRPLPTSPAVDGAVNIPHVLGDSRFPELEYSHPSGYRPRPMVRALDVGAMEYVPSAQTKIEELEFDDAKPNQKVVCPSTNPSPSCTHTSVHDAVNAALDGDTILILGGIFRESAVLSADNVLILAQDGARLEGVAAQGKAALVITGNNTVIDGLECSQIRVPDENGACVRLEGGNLTLRNVYFHDSEQGLLTGTIASGSVVIEDSTFERLGKGGRAHGIYVQEIDELVIRRSKVLSTKDEGHGVKSRAAKTSIEDSIIASLEGNDSRLIDVPNGGKVVIRNSILEEGPNSANYNLIGLGLEGVTHPTQPALIEGNIIIADHNRPLILRGPIEAIFRDNVVVGSPPLDNVNVWYPTRQAAQIPDYPALPTR